MLKKVKLQDTYEQIDMLNEELLISNLPHLHVLLYLGCHILAADLVLAL